jgi:alkanesulfonate monooxygenase SsuD/methylene tetrahydromethanopterin reductase-like flavin-dependent oxidoreductase (luciferase family)
MKFGCQLPQDIDDFDRLIEVAEECERLGYDSVWVYDHLSPFWSRSGKALECWTALSAVAARTNNVKVGSLVTNVVLRNPSLLAKMSSTVDNISGGRLILGLGTGDKLSRRELNSYGYKFPPLDERVERLRESILILKAMWTKDEVTFHGKHYTISHAVNFPKPEQSPHPPIWIGGKHLRIVNVVAELADGWNYWGLSKEGLERRSRYLSTKCTEYRRSPASILKSWSGTFSHLSHGPGNYTELVQKMATALRKQTDAETRYFVASFGPRANPESYQAFAEAVKSLA